MPNNACLICLALLINHSINHPIQVILNPLGFIICEIGLLKEEQEGPPPPLSPQAAASSPLPAIPLRAGSPASSSDEDEGDGAAAAAAASSSGDGRERERDEMAAATFWRAAPLVLFYGDDGTPQPPPQPQPPAGSRWPAPAQEGEEQADAARRSRSRVGATVLRRVGSNPVVLMTFLGLVTGAGLQGRELPPLLSMVHHAQGLHV